MNKFKRAVSTALVITMTLMSGINSYAGGEKRIDDSYGGGNTGQSATTANGGDFGVIDSSCYGFRLSLEL